MDPETSPKTFNLPFLEAPLTSDHVDLLHLIDGLRSQGLVGVVASPKFIVFGQDSDQQSSVIQAIAGIPQRVPFLFSGNFITEVILRRSSVESAAVALGPSRSRPLKEQILLRGLRWDFNNWDEVPELARKAGECLVDDADVERSPFVGDILRLEVSGPNLPQITVVDGLSIGRDGAWIKVVAEYLDDPRSICVAVGCGHSRKGDESILATIKKVDPQGKRTIGVITPPGRLDVRSEMEPALVELVMDHNMKIAHGWSVLGEPDPALDALTRGGSEEIYIKENAFQRLPINGVGVAPLRSYVNSILFDYDEAMLRTIISDIECGIKECQVALEKLGPPRPSVDTRRAFLIDISQSFHSIGQDAIKGQYSDPFFLVDQNPERRLCSILMKKHMKFAENLRNAATWKVEDAASYQESIKNAFEVVKRCQGRELPGQHDPQLIGDLFREQSRNWEKIARDHVKDVWILCRRFADLVLRFLTNAGVSRQIQRHCLNVSMEERFQIANNRLDQLLEVHTDRPMTTNPSFWKGTARLSTKFLNNHRDLEGQTGLPGELLSVTVKAFDNMYSFYEIAMNLFMDNVPTLAINAPIVRSLPTSFWPAAVANLDLESINQLAAESVEQVKERNALAAKLSVFEAAARTCRAYVPQSSKVGSSSELHVIDRSIVSTLLLDLTTEGNEVKPKPDEADAAKVPDNARQLSTTDSASKSSSGIPLHTPASPAPNIPDCNPETKVHRLNVARGSSAAEPTNAASPASSFIERKGHRVFKDQALPSGDAPQSSPASAAALVSTTVSEPSNAKVVYAPGNAAPVLHKQSNNLAGDPQPTVPRLIGVLTSLPQPVRTSGSSDTPSAPSADSEPPTLVFARYTKEPPWAISDYLVASSSSSNIYNPFSPTQSKPLKSSASRGPSKSTTKSGFGSSELAGGSFTFGSLSPTTKSGGPITTAQPVSTGSGPFGAQVKPTPTGLDPFDAPASSVFSTPAKLSPAGSSLPGAPPQPASAGPGLSGESVSGTPPPMSESTGIFGRTLDVSTGFGTRSKFIFARASSEEFLSTAPQKSSAVRTFGEWPAQRSNNEFGQPSALQAKSYITFGASGHNFGSTPTSNSVPHVEGKGQADSGKYQDIPSTAAFRGSPHE